VGLLPLAAIRQRIILLAVTSAIARVLVPGERALDARWFPPLPRRLAQCGALAAATAFTVWNQSVVTRSLHAVAAPRTGAWLTCAGTISRGEGQRPHLLMRFLLARRPPTT